MKVIIAGSRTVTDESLVREAIKDAGFYITEVVSGCARGVDTLGERWAAKNYKLITRFRADWDQYGTRAGPLRNIHMGDYADALIAIWDGKSAGTKHMIQYMQKLKKPVFVFSVLPAEPG